MQHSFGNNENSNSANLGEPHDSGKYPIIVLEPILRERTGKRETMVTGPMSRREVEKTVQGKYTSSKEDTMVANEKVWL